jgi:hypothetical protein
MWSRGCGSGALEAFSISPAASVGRAGCIRSSSFPGALATILTSNSIPGVAPLTFDDTELLTSKGGYRINGAEGNELLRTQETKQTNTGKERRKRGKTLSHPTWGVYAQCGRWERLECWRSSAMSIIDEAREVPL